MQFLSFLEASPTGLVVVTFILGLLIGSFSNVVIFRLPKMMEREWRSECKVILEIPAGEDEPALTLSTPASTCPKCQHKIRWFENIPVVSWLALRGKCSSCSQKISARYPIIELSAAIIAAVAATHFGYGAWLGAVLVAGWILLILALIDFDTTLLPDQLTVPLMWGGILAATVGISPISLSDSVLGAMAGYLSLWSVYWVFKLITGKEGMGYGDFKLLAALGAWMGWQLLPLVILLSSVVGAVVGLLLMTTGIVKRDEGIPFGPYLAAAGWIALLWGNDIVSTYLGLFKY